MTGTKFGKTALAGNEVHTEDNSMYNPHSR